MRRTRSLSGSLLSGTESSGGEEEDAGGDCGSLPARSATGGEGGARARGRGRLIDTQVY